MKRFMMFSISIFCLSLSLLIGFHFGASTAKADFGTSGTVVGFSQTSALTASGEVWLPQTDGTFQRIADRDPPVPVSQIKFYEHNYIVTISDDVWIYLNSIDGWINLGVPGDVTNIEPTTWGQLKVKYEED